MLRKSSIKKHQRGATIIELMMAMTLSVTAFAALASLVGYGMGLNAKLLKSARLNEELGNAMSFIMRDLRRTGFNGATVNMVQDPQANPSAFASSISLGNYAGEPANSCILYSYDNNANGVLDTVVGNNENFGIRLKSQVIQIRTNSLDCGADGWLELTDPSTIMVTNLVFNTTQIVENNVVSTQIDIRLEGQLINNANISRQFTTSLVVRNYD